MIDQILKGLRLDEKNTVKKQILTLRSRLLTRYTKLEESGRVFYYRPVIGKLNNLEEGNHSDISYIMNEFAIFVMCPKREHGGDVKNIGRYLRGARINVLY